MTKIISTFGSVPQKIIDHMTENDYAPLELGKLYAAKNSYHGAFLLTTHLHLWESEEHEHYKVLKVCGRFTNDGINWEEGQFEIKYIYDSRDYIPIKTLSGETPQQTITRINNEVLQAIADPSHLTDELENLDTENALVAVGNKSTYELAYATIEERKLQIQCLKIIAEKKIWQLQCIASDLQKKLKKIRRIIDTIELYLGVREQIIQISEGTPAPAETKITVRQLVLYMDEESGIIHANRYSGQPDGIDFQNIDDFDNWLLQDNNLDFILPEKRGIVAMKPSRRRREYTSDPFDNAFLNAKNDMGYLLIRNGDNLFRIWTSISFGGLLFPTIKDATHIEELFEEAAKSGYEHDKEKAQDEQMVYLRNALIIQGILDRTDLFQPLSVDRIDVFNPNTFSDDGAVYMLRDAELTIADGHRPYKEWKKELNSRIKRGSRILYSGLPWDKDGYSNRFMRYYPHWTPSMPPTGVHKVESVDDYKPSFYSTKNLMLRIMYLPDGDVFVGNWDYKRRTNRVSFYLYPHESCVLNYDGIGLDDIEFYINNRLERRNYIDMLPVLYEIKNARLKEIEQEKDFVKLVAHDMNCSEQTVWDTVEWWKTKNIWKRPLDEDDEKAWRMIRSKIKRSLDA